MKRIGLLLMLAVIVFASSAVRPPSAAAQGTTARALVQVNGTQSTFDASGNFVFRMTVWVYPATGGSVTLDSVSASAAPGDTMSTVLTNLTTAVVNAASAQGYNVARTAVLLPQYVRGQ